jgi:hypothetical protein
MDYTEDRRAYWERMDTRTRERLMSRMGEPETFSGQHEALLSGSAEALIGSWQIDLDVYGADSVPAVCESMERFRVLLKDARRASRTTLEAEREARRAAA